MILPVTRAMPIAACAIALAFLMVSATVKAFSNFVSNESRVTSASRAARSHHSTGIEDCRSPDDECHDLPYHRRRASGGARGQDLTAKKNFVWTCNKDTKEQASNVGSVVGIMRITDLKA
jgi:hypothetical protein